MTTTTQVFVVDRDQSARVGLVRLLHRAGHDASGFASTMEFLDALDPGASGCLVLDSETAGPTGKDLQAELKARGMQLPIIMVSSKDNHRIRQGAREMKAVGLYRKPVDGPALLDAVKWALEVSEMA